MLLKQYYKKRLVDMNASLSKIPQKRFKGNNIHAQQSAQNTCKIKIMF